MKYYKILKDGMRVDVNHLFFRGQQKFGRIISCNPEHAQLICSSDGTQFYTAKGLRMLEKELPNVFEVEMKIISEEEYNELKAQLEDVKEIMPQIVELEPVPTQKQEVEKEPEKVMTMTEMWAKITKLEKIIEDLKSKQ